MDNLSGMLYSMDCKNSVSLLIQSEHLCDNLLYCHTDILENHICYDSQSRQQVCFMGKIQVLKVTNKNLILSQHNYFFCVL